MKKFNAAGIKIKYEKIKLKKNSSVDPRSKGRIKLFSPLFNPGIIYIVNWVNKNGLVTKKPE